MTRLLLPNIVAALVVAAAAGRVAAQTPARAFALPAHEPLNPSVAARSGLLALPLVPTARRWQVDGTLVYGSAVERNLNFPDRYLLDAELARAQLDVRRSGYDGRAFAQLTVGVESAQAGFADAFFEGYHRLIHWVMEERDARPRDRYGDALTIAEYGIDVERPPTHPALADTRITVGWRDDARVQTALSVTLPTAPSSSLFARGVATASLLQAAEVEVHPRVALSGTAGIGFAGTHGALAAIQREAMFSASGTGRLRLTDGQAVYMTLFYHSPAYHESGLPELDAGETSVDFGYLRRTRGGRTWSFGLTEDTRRRDAGIDLILKVGVR